MTNADGSNVHWVTTDTSLDSSKPAWSPDGRRLVAEVGGILSSPKTSLSSLRVGPAVTGRA